MDKIDSFLVDHERLKRGIYVSRVDTFWTAFPHVVTTIDIRMKEPNKEPGMSPEAMHSIEHIGATYLRSNKEWGRMVVYFGHMGCQTGFYLILFGKHTSEDIAPLVADMMRFISEYAGEIPGVSPSECGNYKLHDLDTAKAEARRYLDEVIRNLDESNLYYPKVK